MNKKTVFVRSIMFISSYVPLYILLIIMNAPRLHQVIINHDYNYTYTIVLYGLILLIVISLSSIYFFKRVKYTNICEMVLCQV